MDWESRGTTTCNTAFRIDSTSNYVLTPPSAEPVHLTSEKALWYASETSPLICPYCGQLYRIERRNMMALLLGWLKSILRIGILDFLSKIGLKAALGILLTAVAVVAGLFLIVGLLVGLIF
jgi:hypothetical protein